MRTKQIPQHELCKNASTTIYAIFNDRRFQKWAFERRSDFRSGKKKNCNKSKKQDGFHYFETKRNSLKEIDDFNRNVWTTFSRDYTSTTIERD